VVVTVCLLLAAVNVAVTAPGAVGAKRTETVHALPGPRLGGQVSVVIVNTADPDTRKVSAPDARPPVFTSVNALSGRSPTETWPKSYGAGWKANTTDPAAADADYAGTPTNANAVAAASDAPTITPRIAAPLFTLTRLTASAHTSWIVAVTKNERQGGVLASLMVVDMPSRVGVLDEVRRLRSPSGTCAAVRSASIPRESRHGIGRLDRQATAIMLTPSRTLVMR
jgi:hypothetical protein